ncbi:MAG: transglutaminase family protein [Methylococcales bacterium]|nr:transglutaminase family protein [Methylococcales bacterium]
MKLKVSCDLHFESVESSFLILMLRPFRGQQQAINNEVYLIEPVIPLIETTDSFGNSCQHLMTAVGDMFINTSAEVVVAEHIEVGFGACFVAIQHLPYDVLPFLLPSRYCESDRFGDLAREITTDTLLGYNQVSKINDWVRASISYTPGSSEFPLSATEIYHLGYGVCRDLAQVAIALCRSISIPARLVVGYLYNLQPMDLHAWFEAYVGGCWYTFNPTQQDPKGGRVIIAFGRDAADVSIFHQFGSGCQLNSMDVRVDLLDNRPILTL